MNRSWRVVLTLFAVVPALAITMTANMHALQGPASVPGLEVSYRDAGSNEIRDVMPSLLAALYVKEGDPVTPFMPAGGFVAIFDGFISVDLRDDYQFRVEARGRVQLTINYAVFFDADGRESATDPSGAVRLNRGANK